MASYTSLDPSAHPNTGLLASKLFDVSGFKAVVTGGGTGIGLMITQALVANGATVYISGRRKEALDTVVEKYSGKGGPNAGKIIAAPADITDKEDIKRLALEIKEKEPNGIHLLVNNAGVAKEKQTTSYKTGEPDFSNADSITEHLWKATPESWAETFETNLTAQFFCSVAFLPLLSKGTANTLGYSASIINITSISGVLKGSSSGQFAYATSKAGFIHLTRMLGTTFADCKVRVNSIAPGIFPSEMTADSSDENQKSELKGMGQSLPAKRTGGDADMAAAVLYLAGPGGVFLNGQVLYPDGGNVLTSPSST
ncbi:uncharacterized protein H6S33_008539 [Morchella sextelata]|uniref:uncharacterized protein n=1 Tax=Morchella sextelata TaxID=1174677 RepID=UPI001D03B0A9|nr:uncharacterized protein H6S33_008539 [Morchella sextelata]KAH0602889.1 hypothetical protein H6S33_008539 [Morchella sextelata]